MNKKLDENIEKIIKEIGVPKDQAVWDCHGTPVFKHKALEKVAVSRNIKFDPPQVLESNSKEKIVSILVNGSMADKSEWSIGEASPHNNKNSYPYAMAEKRAKDRVILKLVGLHGDVYAEDEADSFKEERPVEVKGGTAKKEFGNELEDLAEKNPIVKEIVKNFPDAKLVTDFGDEKDFFDLEDNKQKISTKEKLVEVTKGFIEIYKKDYDKAIELYGKNKLLFMQLQKLHKETYDDLMGWITKNTIKKGEK
tara:strand:- start:204 stop:959 length:756 start_codon:yes stop_codon:yes gene_type:complete